MVGLLDGLARVQIKQDSYVDAAKGHLEQLMFATAEHVKDGSQWRLKAQACDGYVRALMSVGLWREALWVLDKWLFLAQTVKDRGEQAKVHGLTGVVHLREGSLSLATTVRVARVASASLACYCASTQLNHTCAAHPRLGCVAPDCSGV